VGELDSATPVWQVGQRFGCSGYVAESVPLALFAAQRIGRNEFEQVVQDAIEAGGDTDTIGSTTGQVAGAWAGLGRIPEELVQKLSDRGAIIQTARAFASLVSSGQIRIR
jgi:ADP-ribosylglycohydrolase